MDMSTFSIPISTKKDAREVGDITTRLQKVLSDVELLFEEEEDDYGSIAAERRQFQSRYGNLSAEVDARAKERSEMLKSLAEMLDTDSSTKEKDAVKLKMEEEDTARMDDLSEHIETTKVGFEKLQKLKEEMHSLASKGKSTQHLQEEKSNLRLKVVEKFKLLYSAKMLRNKNKTLGNHWKHAAEEIVNVLQRIRAEGLESIEDLEQMLLNAEKSVKRQAENMVKLEHKVLEKQKAVDALNKTLAVTTNENELLRSEVERYQDQVIAMKKEIRKLEAEATPKEEPELMDSHTQTFLSMVTLISTINEEVSAASSSTSDDRQYLKSVASVVDAATEKHELELKVDNLEKKIIEKETQIMMMEHKLSEQGVSVDHEHKPVTLSDIPPQPEIKSPPLEDLSSPREVSPEVKGQSSQTFQVNFNDDAKQKIKELTEDKELLLVEMEKLREQFAQATREIVTLKYADREQPYMIGMKDSGVKSKHGPHSRTNVPGIGGGPSDASDSEAVKERKLQDDGSKVAEGKSQPQQVTTVPSSLSQPPMPRDKTTKHTTPQYYSQPAFQSQYQQKSYTLPPHPPQQFDMPQEDDPGLRQSFVPLESNAIQGEQAVAHSNKTLAGQGRVQGTILPPAQRNEFSNYMAFPTKGFLPPQAPKMFQYQGKSSSLGTEDATQNESLSATGSEVKPESFVNEIQNYSEYLKDLMQGEIARLTHANEELKRRLSERSLRQFDQLYAHLVNPPPLKEEPQSISPLPQRQIRRGRFELLKEGRPSPFLSKNAFATLQSGGRNLHQSSSASEQRVKPVMPFQDAREEAAWYAPGEQIDAFSQPPLKATQPRYQTVGAMFADESLPTSSSQKGTTFSKDMSHVDRSQQGPLQQKDDVDQYQDTLSLQHENQQLFGGKRLLKYGQQQTLPQSLGDIGVTHEKPFMPASGRTAGIYKGRLPEWDRRRSQFSAGMEAIEGLTGTSMQFKQTMASQFAKHFCLSEIKRAKEEEVEMAKREIPGKDDGSRGILQTAHLMHPYQHVKSEEIQLPAGLTASQDLFAQRMTSLLESTNISDGNGYYSADQGIPGRQLLRPMQTRSLSSIESSHRYLPSLLIHPNQERTNRLLMMLPKAKYPGRGYVVLQTDRFSIYDGRILRNNAEDKPISHRPVPKNYNKLWRRNRELLERQRKKAQGECKDQQTLRNMINFEEGMKFDHSLREMDENSSKDGENLQNFKRRDIIRNAQEQLFNPELLRNKYQGLIVNEKA